MNVPLVDCEGNLYGWHEVYSGTISIRFEPAVCDEEIITSSNTSTSNTIITETINVNDQVVVTVSTISNTIVGRTSTVLINSGGGSITDNQIIDIPICLLTYDILFSQCSEYFN